MKSKYIQGAIWRKLGGALEGSNERGGARFRVAVAGCIVASGLGCMQSNLLMALAWAKGDGTIITNIGVAVY